MICCAPAQGSRAHGGSPGARLTVPAPSSNDDAPEQTGRGKRLLWVVAALIALFVVGRLLGFDHLLAPENLHRVVEDAGAWGHLMFAGVFVGSVLLQVPGMVFVSAAPLLFSPTDAWWLCLVAGNLSVNLNFLLVRKLGGGEPVAFRQAWARRLLDRLERHPLRSLTLLRAAFSMFPPLTGALALTPVSARDHAIASALGLLLPITGVIWFEALLMR